MYIVHPHIDTKWSMSEHITKSLGFSKSCCFDHLLVGDLPCT